MGHSTVSFTINKMANRDEIMKEFKARQEDSRAEYGYSENPDSFAHADAPSVNTYEVFSEDRVRELFDSIKNYESKAIYFVNRSDWNKVFFKQKSKIPALNKKIEKLKVEFNKLIETTYPMGIPSKVLKTNEPVENIFLSCPDCSSKLNIVALLKVQRETLKRCPVCKSDNKQIESKWREKCYNKSYAKKYEKMAEKIETLRNSIKEEEALEKNSLPSKLNVQDLEKYPALKGKVKTIVFADVHH